MRINKEVTSGAIAVLSRIRRQIGFRYLCGRESRRIHFT
jgi:hypothetical protein